MRNYPKSGDKVIIKDGNEIAIVMRIWKPKRVQLIDGRIFYLRGLKRCNH